MVQSCSPCCTKCTMSTIWFLGPTRVHSPNDISISSAIFAQLRAESPILYNVHPLSSFKIAASHGDLDPRLMRASVGPPNFTTERHFDRFSSFCRAYVHDRSRDWPTDNTTPSVTVGRMYILVLRCSLIIIIITIMIMIPRIMFTGCRHRSIAIARIQFTIQFDECRLCIMHLLLSARCHLCQ